MDLRLIDAASVHRLLDYAPTVEALAAAHREAPPLVGRSLLEPPPGAGRVGEGFLVLPAWAHGRAFGVKMVTIVPGNAEHRRWPADGAGGLSAVRGGDRPAGRGDRRHRAHLAQDRGRFRARRQAARPRRRAHAPDDRRGRARSASDRGASRGPALARAGPGLEPQRAAARPPAGGARAPGDCGRGERRPRGRGARRRRDLGRDACL